MRATKHSHLVGRVPIACCGSNRTLRILVLNKTSKHGGGASRMGEAHAHALREAGHHATVWRRYRTGSLAHRLAQKFALKLHLNWHCLKLPPVSNYDIVHIHDSWSALSARNVAWLASRTPVCLTLHDCSSFTGGCLYPFSCVQFAEPTGCKSCPRARPQFHTRQNIAFKRARFPAARLSASAPSQWMTDLANRSMVFARPVRHIPNFVSNSFSPSLFPSSAIPTVLIGTTTLADSRKGGDYLLPILSRLKERGSFKLCVFGKSLPTWTAELDVQTEFLGYLQTEKELAQAYRCADAYLFPSILDNAPLTVIESLRCGTPVFTWKTGGTHELFRQGESGWCTEVGQVEQLAGHLANYLELGLRERSAFRLNAARQGALYNSARYVADHLEWYEECLQGSSRHRI